MTDQSRPTSQPSSVFHTPLHHWHVQHRARFMESDGWQVPAAYADVAKETAAAHTGLILADVSFFAKVSLVGRGVPALTRDLAGDGAVSRVGGVSALDAGTTILACRLSEDQLLLLAATPATAALEAKLGTLLSGREVVRSDATTTCAGYYLAGPDPEETLQRLTALDISPAALPPGSCAETGLAGVPALLVRPPEGPLPCLYLAVSWDLTEYVWERLLEVGRSRGIVPVGLETLRTLGLVAG
jgi:aminomethyltransferase